MVHFLPEDSLGDSVPHCLRGNSSNTQNWENASIQITTEMREHGL